jgi:hypothetical protein
MIYIYQNNMSTEDGGDEILNKINAIKTRYYLANTKHMLFKNEQKFDCAKTIVDNMDLNLLFNSIIQIRGTNELHFNYTVFKTVVNPSIYNDLISFIFKTNDHILETCSSYTVYIDVKGLTMTGVERYKDFVVLLSDQGKINGKNFLEKLTNVYIVNPPFMISNIGKILLPLLDKIVKDKIVLM